MTERLYYRQPGLLEFDAVIADIGNSGDLFYTVLDRSAFYPTSGGQLHDTGRIGDIDIVEVIESIDGDVWHLSKSSPGEKGNRVHGEINGDRRWRNRQLHTAQHILSQAFIRRHGWETVSVHLGEEYGAIELASAALDQQSLVETEQLAASVIRQNLAVEILFIDSNDIASTPLRKIPDRQGTIRVIKIGEFDWSACGGTHCVSTAEVSLIKIVGLETIRGHSLVRFLAGAQALEDYSARFGITDELARSLTCHFADLPARFDKMSAENRELRKQLSDARKRLLPILADEIAQIAIAYPEPRVVSSVQSSMDGATASQLAQLVADKVSGAALVLVDGRLVLAVPDARKWHAGELIKAIASSLGLRGGGSNRVAQMGGLDASRLPEIEKLLRERLTRA
ncbi:MAG: DHHA1 domain-containing protein [Candidatus Zixiibacteriota bacterium]